MEGKQAVDRERLDPLIEVEHLGHIYMAGTPLAQRALAGVGLKVSARHSHGLLGATGSGKSTLLQHLNGLLRPQEGKVRVGNFDLNDHSIPLKSVISQVGLVFQNPEAQFFEQYVGDEIAYGPRQIPSDAPLVERVRSAMELVGLDFNQFKDRLTFTLSGGERRKVALASILALNPSILLLDEPTAGLDPASERDLLAHLKQLQEGGMTLVVSSHQMEVINALVENLTVMEGGQDVLSGRTGEVFSQTERLRACGLEPPLVAQAAEGLRQQGWPLPAGITQADELVERIGQLVAG